MLVLLALGGLAVVVFAPAEFEGTLQDIRENVRQTLGLDDEPSGTPSSTASRTPSGSPTPSSTLEPTDPDEREAAIEQHFHELINETRVEHGLEELELDEELAVVARYYSQQMGTHGFFAHVSPVTGRDPTERGRLFDYNCTKVSGLMVRSGIGENLYMKRGPERPPEEEAQRAHDGLMSSEGHRENILREVYDVEGIGVYENDDGLWLTQNFC